MAALVAGTKKLDPAPVSYAKMLYTAHGTNLDETQKVGKQIKVTPRTETVDKLRVVARARDRDEPAHSQAPQGLRFLPFCRLRLKGVVTRLILDTCRTVARQHAC